MYLFNQSDIAIAAILAYYALTNHAYVTSQSLHLSI